MAEDDDGIDEALGEIDAQFLVHEILFKGLVTLLVDKKVFTPDEITAHLLDQPEFRQLQQFRPEAMPLFERLLADLWKRG